MTSQDYPEVREHLSKCWRETYAHRVQPSDFAKMLASLNNPGLGLVASDGLALVALDTQGKRVVGTAMAAERRGVGYVWGTYVATDKKRCGVGRALINEVFTRLPSAQQLSVIVLKASSGAEAFYRAQGFVAVKNCDHELAPGKYEPATVLVHQRAVA